MASDVRRFGSKGDKAAQLQHFRSTPRSRRRQCAPPCPLSAKKRTPGLQQMVPLLDHLVGTQKDRSWQCNTDCFGRFEVHGEHVVGNLLDSQIGRSRAPQYFCYVGCSAAPQRSRVHAVSIGSSPPPRMSQFRAARGYGVPSFRWKPFTPSGPDLSSRSMSGYITSSPAVRSPITRKTASFCVRFRK
jgi:hypothetical protein